jgi:hypothetical protein
MTVQTAPRGDVPTAGGASVGTCSTVDRRHVDAQPCSLVDNVYECAHWYHLTHVNVVRIELS